MERRRKAMWLYPKVVGFNPPERWGHSACFFEGVVYVFGVCFLIIIHQPPRVLFHFILLIPPCLLRPCLFSL
jgi:hypothetical protein